MFLRPFGLYRNACFGILFVSILFTCCSHFFWYCFISFTMFCAPVFPLIHWFFSLSNFVIPSKCLKNFICAASKRCSSLFFSTQASLPNFNAALAVMLWILNFVSLLICFPKCLRKAPFILFYVFLAQKTHQWARASSFTRFLDHTQRHTRVGRTPLDEWSAPRKDLYLTTYNSHNRETSMLPVGFEPTNPASERPQTYALDRAATGISKDLSCQN